MADVSVSLDLEAKALYSELVNVQNRFVSFASKITEEGGKAGQSTGFKFGETLGRGLKGAGETFLAAGRALFTSVTALFGGIGIGAVVGEIVNVVKLGGHMKDLSDSVGISARTLSQWAFAAETAGVQAEQVAKSIAFLEKTREKAVQQGPRGELAASYARLGVSFEDLSNQAIPVNEIMAKLGAGSLNAADGAAVMGKSFYLMAPVLEQVANGTLKLTEGISDIDAAKLDAVGDAFTNLKNAIAVDLAPIIVSVFESIEDHFDIFITHIKEAVAQLTALNAAGKSKTPSEFFESLSKGSQETDKLEQDLFNRQTERQKKRIVQEAEAKAGPKTKIGKVSGEEPGEEKEKAKEEEKLATKRERVAELTERQRLEELPPEERKAELEQKVVEVRKIETSGKDEEDRLDATEKRLGYEKEIGSINKELTRESEKGAKETERDRDKEAKEEATAAKEQLKTDLKLAREERDYARNPTGLSLKDYATEGRGTVRSLAQEAQREEAAARREQLGGNLAEAKLHQNRAEKLKQSLGLPSKEDQKLAIKEGLDESNLLKQIEKNTAGAGANK